LARIYGYESPEELMSCMTDIQHQLYVEPQRRQELQRLLTEKSEVHGFESMVYRKDRTVIWISENVRAVRDRNRGILCYEGFVEDITERKGLEEQLRQAQKMDAIGKLAGGVAHDFNNLLTVIMGYSDVVCDRLRPADPLRDFVEEI
jgi:PAS domain S-box-containing protein